jgi:hypothetical protein
MLTIDVIRDNYNFIEFNQHHLNIDHIAIPYYNKNEHHQFFLDDEPLTTLSASFTLEYTHFKPKIYNAPVRDPYHLIEFDKYISEAIKELIFTSDCQKIFFSNRETKDNYTITNKLIELHRKQLYNINSRYEKSSIIMSSNFYDVMYDVIRDIGPYEDTRCSINFTGKYLLDFPVYVDFFTNYDYIALIPSNSITTPFQILYRPYTNRIKFCIVPTNNNWNQAVHFYHQDNKQDLMLRPIEEDTAQPDNFFSV